MRMAWQRLMQFSLKFHSAPIFSLEIWHTIQAHKNIRTKCRGLKSLHSKGIHTEIHTENWKKCKKKIKIRFENCGFFTMIHVYMYVHTSIHFNIHKKTYWTREYCRVEQQKWRKKKENFKTIACRKMCKSLGSLRSSVQIALEKCFCAFSYTLKTHSKSTLTTYMSLTESHFSAAATQYWKPFDCASFIIQLC